jgi:Ser/Thr protein kinase RdoA (MazF antagonist)
LAERLAVGKMREPFSPDGSFKPELAMPASDAKKQQQILSHLTSMLSAGRLSPRPIATIEPLLDGNTSRVYKLIDVDGAARVLKVVQDADFLKAEAAFLEAWRAIGIRTPAVYELGELDEAGEFPYLLIEFIEGDNLLTLMEAGQVPGPQVLQDIGARLARMHTVRGVGFGPIHFQNGTLIGQFGTFGQALAEGDFHQALQINLAQQRLDQADLTVVQTAIQMLDRHSAVTGSVYAHTDFRAGNILYQAGQPDPYVIIDPAPRLWHPYRCLAYSWVLEQIHGRRDPLDLMIGYRRITAIDQAIFEAAVVLTTADLLSHWGHDDHPYAANLRALFQTTKQTISATA